MALTEPFDVLPDFPGWVTAFEPRRRQEQSRTAAGRTITKDLGPPLWRLAAQSKILTPNLLDHWRARLETMEEGMATFKGYSLSRTYPILYPNGSWPAGGSPAFDGLTASLHSIGAERKSVRIKDLPFGFTLSIGDLFSIGGTDLHRVVEVGVAAGGGITNEFEVRPHIWPDVSADSPAPAISVYRPYCIMCVVPGSIDTSTGLDGRGSVTFEAMEAR